MSNSFDENWPCSVKFPSWLKKNGYKVPTNPKNGPFIDAFGTTQWEYFAENPERGRSFDIFMTGQREGRANWLNSYPFDKRLLAGFNGQEDDVLLVDVAGGQGHDLQDFRKHIGSTPCRLVLQDLPHVFMQMSEEYKTGIELVEYDFFTPQPIKGKFALWANRAQSIDYIQPPEHTISDLFYMIGMTKAAVVFCGIKSWRCDQVIPE